MVASLQQDPNDPCLNVCPPTLSGDDLCNHKNFEKIMVFDF